MVGGEHDRGEREQRVRTITNQRSAAARREDHRPRDRQRPAEVQRRHRRELVGEARVRAPVPVRRRADDASGVDEAEAREHARRRERVEHVDRRARRASSRSSRAGTRRTSSGWRAYSQKNASRGHHDVREEVVRVEHPLDGRARADHRVLEPRFGEDAAASRSKPINVACVLHRVVGFAADE